MLLPANLPTITYSPLWVGSTTKCRLVIFSSSNNNATEQKNMNISIRWCYRGLPQYMRGLIQQRNWILNPTNPATCFCYLFLSQRVLSALWLCQIVHVFRGRVFHTNLVKKMTRSDPADATRKHLDAQSQPSPSHYPATMVGYKESSNGASKVIKGMSSR